MLMLPILLSTWLAALTFVAPGCGENPQTPSAGAARETSNADDTLDALDERYGAILSKVVTDDGLVRYERLAEKEMERELAAVVEGFASIDRPEDGSRRLAFWCNAYNANVLLMATRESRKPSFTSVINVPGFFDERTIRVAGETLTLNDLENERVRPLNDPRIHAALVCAAISCPPLRNEPYRADSLGEQLNDQSRRWVNDASKNGVEGDQLSLSRIFDWYGADFDVRPYGGIVPFVRRFADPDGSIASLLARRPDPRISFREYDWALNRAKD